MLKSLQDHTPNVPERNTETNLDVVLHKRTAVVSITIALFKPA